jgi:outer membrane protein assembly factor BamB
MAQLTARVLRILLVFVFALEIPGISLASAPAAEPAAQVQDTPTPNSIELSGHAPDATYPNSYISVPYAEELNPSGGAITIEAWVKPVSTAYCQTIVGNNYKISYWLGICGGKIRFYPHGVGSAVEGTGSLPAGAWSHIAVTYNGKFRRYYINGVLDLNSGENPGAITPGEVNQPLEIGADMMGGYYFGGRIQELRIWNVARTGQQIVTSMNQFVGGPMAGLVAEWPFAGNTDDPAGGHNGVGVDVAYYSLDVAIPRTIHIPQVAVTPVLDGFCDAETEYGSAIEVMVGDAYISLLHTADDLWICFTDLTEPAGGVTDNWAAVYLDPDYSHGGYMSWRGYYSIELHAFGEHRRARHASSSGSFTPIPYNPADWDGVYNTGDGEWVGAAEFRISRQFIGGWPRYVGLNLAQHGVLVDGDGLLWPSRVTINNPVTWGTGLLPAISAQSYTFSGRVTYQSQAGEALSGLPGVRIRLSGIDIDPGRTEIPLDEVESGLDGSFSMAVSDAYTEHRLTLEPTGLPAGLTPVRTSAPSGSGSTSSIHFGSLASGTYPNNNFYLGDPMPQPLDVQGGPYFLIITSDANVSALNNFVAYKSRLGFQVEVVTLSTITATSPGGTLPEKIRNFEITRKATYGARFRYLLLIGSNNTIPFTRFSVFATRTSEAMNKLEPTDWYYADLTTVNWDSNGNGWLVDGIWSKPEDRAPGYIPDSGIDFIPAVALGRLPFDTPDLLTRYLNYAMSFEQSTPAYKTRALLAGAMLTLEGRCWYPLNPSGHWVTNDPEHCESVWGISTDGSRLLERIKNETLIPNGFTNTTTFYENEHPATGHSPAANISPQPLTEANVLNALANNDYGLVNLVGHGNYNIIGRLTWATDDNGSNIIESPAGPPGYIKEPGGENLLVTDDLPAARSPVRKPGIFVTQSCLTILYDHTNTLGSRMLSDGYAVGYVGGLGLEWGGADLFNATVTDQILVHGRRLGDAFWRALRYHITLPLPNTSFLVEDLFGDPTLSYWGNPGQQAVQAPWPMQRADSTGRSETSLPGPSVANLQWSLAGTAPYAVGLPPSPVASSAGEVIVANGAGVDVIVNGSLYQRLALDTQAYGSPAVAADGTIYALDTSGGLYAFQYTTELRACFRGGCGGGNLVSPNRTRRWKTYLGGNSITSPVIGSDGFIFAARAYGANSVIEVFRPDGREAMVAQVSGQITGGLTVTPDQMVYVAASGGRLVSIDFFCSVTNNNACLATNTISGTYTTAPLAAGRSIYVGMADGRLVKKARANLATEAFYMADSAITSGPVLGPDGQVAFGTQNGTLYSLDAATLALRWSRATGAALGGLPAFSSTGFYVASGNYLRAYSPVNGAPLWAISMDSESGSGGVAVGYGREILVQMSNGAIKDIGEGWMHQPWYFSVTPVISGSGQNAAGTIRLQWSYMPPPFTLQNGLAGPLSPADSVPTQYLLQRSDDGADWVDVDIIPAGSLPTDVIEYTDEDTLPGHTYAYRIQTLDPTGQGLDADFATGSAQLALPSLPGAPTLTGVLADGAHSLVVSWTPGSGDASNFRVERAPLESGPYNTVTTVTSAAGNAFTDTGLDAGAPYWYQVIALNDTGESLPSNALAGTTHALSLMAPTNVHATLIDSSSVEVTWDAGPVGATAYVESNPYAVAGFIPAGTAPAIGGTFTFVPESASNYGFQVKFVMGSSESEYTQADLRVSTGGFAPYTSNNIYLPIVMR